MSDNNPSISPFDDFPWRKNRPNPWNRRQMRDYQKRLDAIAGKSATGASRVRLIWAADPVDGMQIYNGERRFKYFVSNTIALQRFVLEQLHEPAEYKPDWDQGRYKWGDTGRIDLKGDPPANGLYTHLYTVAEHDYRCCNGTQLIGGYQACYGFFGLPDDNELELVRMAISLRDKTPELRPGEVIPQAELEKELRETKYWEEYNREKTREEFRQVLVDEFTTHSHSIFTDDESVLRHGKYHWVRAHSKSGLTLAEKLGIKESNANSNSDGDKAASGRQGIQSAGRTETDAAAA